MAPTPAELRSWLGSQIRDRVVGPDADVRRTELFDTDEPGWFDDDAPIRRVHADASMFVGGMRALLFQSLHPLAMAGVAQHSDYRADPVGTAAAHRRLSCRDHVRASLRSTAGGRRRASSSPSVLSARQPDGRPYAANDPHLLHWVHIAELDSFLAAHDRFGQQPLLGSERDQYVAAVGGRRSRPRC